MRPTPLFCVLFIAVSYGAMLGSLPAEHPLTHSLLLSGPRAVFSFLGSRPAKQLSLHERWLCLGLLAGMLIIATFTFAHFMFLRLVCLSLVAVVSLAADLVQARRLSDARFLFLWGWFHVPLGLSFWACGSADGAAKAKALASKPSGLFAHRSLWC